MSQQSVAVAGEGHQQPSTTLTRNHVDARGYNLDPRTAYPSTEHFQHSCVDIEATAEHVDRSTKAYNTDDHLLENDSDGACTRRIFVAA